MPQLKPETISMTGLNLFQHLCNLARLATSALDNASSCEVGAPTGSCHMFLLTAELPTLTCVCVCVAVWDGPAVGNRPEGSVS